jgi:tRNA-dihydrouridine synthase B
MVKIRNIELPAFPLLLAPMEDVSDPPFRAVCKKEGADLMYTEFISVEGLVRDAHKSRQKLDVFDYEKPIGIQIFGADIDHMGDVVPVIENANPDLIDINFGCPVQKVVCKMAGAGILRDVPLMIKLTERVVKASKLPVTVKTRLGWDEDSINIVEVAERLQDVGIEALTIHGRTRKQMYKGEANWEWIAKVKENPRMKIPIFGNGDIDSPEKAKLYKERYAVDGIMIGRASIGYPWIFREIKHYFEFGTQRALPTVAERVEAARQHLRYSIEWKGQKLGILEMRRHYTNYFRGFEHIKFFRMKLVSTESPQELFDILDDIERIYSNPELLEAYLSEREALAVAV